MAPASNTVRVSPPGPGGLVMARRPEVRGALPVAQVAAVRARPVAAEGARGRAEALVVGRAGPVPGTVQDQGPEATGKGVRAGRGRPNRLRPPMGPNPARLPLRPTRFSSPASPGPAPRSWAPRRGQVLTSKRRHTRRSCLRSRKPPCKASALMWSARRTRGRFGRTSRPSGAAGEPWPPQGRAQDHWRPERWPQERWPQERWPPERWPQERWPHERWPQERLATVKPSTGETDQLVR